MRVPRRKPRAANVGLFGVGHHTYWGQFDGLLDEMHHKLDIFTEKVRGHDVQFLVRSGITTPEEVASEDPKKLLKKVLGVVNSPEGERILRSGKEPDLAEVKDWIEWAKQARSNSPL